MPPWSVLVTVQEGQPIAYHSVFVDPVSSFLLKRAVQSHGWNGAVRVLMLHHVAPCYFQRARDDSFIYSFAGYIHTMHLSW
jgi:hypothetical protein